MPTVKYPKFVGVSLEELTYQQMKFIAKKEERNPGSQARFWIKQGMTHWKLFRVCEFMAQMAR